MRLYNLRSFGCGVKLQYELTSFAVGVSGGTGDYKVDLIDGAALVYCLKEFGEWGGGGEL